MVTTCRPCFYCGQFLSAVLRGSHVELHLVTATFRFNAGVFFLFLMQQKLRIF